MERDEEIDHELRILKKKRNLLSKTKVLKEKRIKTKINNPQPVSSWKDLINTTSSEKDSRQVADLKSLKELLHIESHDFEKNDNDKYTAKITMDYLALAVEFAAENTSTEDKQVCKIKNLSAKISDIDECYVSELQGCIDYCEEINDLQLLMYSIIDYQRKHNDRVNLTEKITNLEGLYLKHSKHDETIFYVCSDKKPRTVYCKVNWRLKFSFRSLSFLHWFDFEDGDQEGFVRSNKRLLQTFNIKDNVSLKAKWRELHKVIKNSNESSE